MTREEVVLISLGVIMVSLILLQVVIMNTLSVTGGSVSRLQDAVTRLKHDNSLLRERVLNESSYTVIDQKAKQQGFINAKYLYL